MAAEEYKRSYIILRDDDLLLHTRPITRAEALWLAMDAYKGVRDRAARIRYLEEYGNVLDVEDYMERLRQNGLSTFFQLAEFTGVYASPRNFVDLVVWLSDISWLEPQARQAFEELAERASRFLRRPVRPRPIGFPPVRYLEMSRLHFRPWPEWHARGLEGAGLYGISVFKDSFWLWRQDLARYHVQAILVRRDVSDKDVIAALARDAAAAGMAKEGADQFRLIIDKHEDEMRRAGYGDVVDRARALMAASMLLAA